MDGNCAVAPRRFSSTTSNGSMTLYYWPTVEKPVWKTAANHKTLWPLPGKVA